MSAELLFRDKYVYADGATREMVIWKLEETGSEPQHRLKYRLFCGYPDRCLVRYDNERSKGDHRHYGSRDESYEFVSVKQLIADFKMDIERLRGDSHE